MGSNISMIGSFRHSLPPSSLGSFSKLPLELRREIWRYFMPDTLHTGGPVKWRWPAQKLSIKLSSRQIREEISDLLYDRNVHFEIRYRKDPRFGVTLITSGLPFNNRSDLERLNFAKFNSISFKLVIPETLSDFDDVVTFIQWIKESIQKSYHPSKTRQERYRNAMSRTSLDKLPTVTITFVRYERRDSSMEENQCNRERLTTIQDFRRALGILHAFHCLNTREKPVCKLPPDLEKPLDPEQPEREADFITKEYQSIMAAIQGWTCKKCRYL